MRITRVALIMWTAAAAAYGREAPQKLTLALRMGAADRLVLMPLAQDVASKMFAKVGIELEWKAGKRTEFEQPAILVEVVSDTPPAFRPGVLGYARFEDTSVRVFLDRIEEFECSAIVLAHVLVHEITHVLQSIGRHSGSGVMKAEWSRRDYAEMRHRPLPFAAEDVDLIARALSSRTSRAAGLPALTTTIDNKTN